MLPKLNISVSTYKAALSVLPMQICKTSSLLIRRCSSNATTNVPTKVINNVTPFLARVGIVSNTNLFLLYEFQHIIIT